MQLNLLLKVIVYLVCLIYCPLGGIPKGVTIHFKWLLMANEIFNRAQVMMLSAAIHTIGQTAHVYLRITDKVQLTDHNYSFSQAVHHASVIVTYLFVNVMTWLNSLIVHMLCFLQSYTKACLI